MKKWILIIVTVLLTFLIVVFNSFKKDKKEVNLALSDTFRSLDPALAFDDNSLQIMAQSLDTLYQYHYLKRPYEVIPLIADGLPKISEDGRTYTIKIKKGIRYHDKTSFLKINREVKAEDFIIAIKRLAFKPIKSSGRWLFSKKVVGFDEFSEQVGSDFTKFVSTEIRGLKALDDYTLQINLVNPEPNLLNFFCMLFTTPIPKELVLKYDNKLDNVLVGTGPFYLDKMSKNKFEFRRNKNYMEEFYPAAGDRFANTANMLDYADKKLPLLDSLNFYVVESDQERWNLILDQKIDLLNVPKQYLEKVINPQELESIKQQNAELELKFFTTMSFRWLGFNMSDPIIGKNKKLRLAIAHAIDFEKYLDIMSNNTNLRANSIFNPGIVGYRPTNSYPFKYNLEKAKRLISESGVDLNKFELTYTTRGSQTIHMKEANFLIDQLKKIGVKINVEALTFSTFLKQGRAGNLDFFTDGWIYDYPDPSNIIQLLLSKNAPGINKSQYDSKEIDKIYAQLLETTVPEEREFFVNKIEKIVLEDVPWIPLMYDSAYILKNNKLKNYRKSFFIRNYVKYLSF